MRSQFGVQRIGQMAEGAGKEGVGHHQLDRPKREIEDCRLVAELGRLGDEMDRRNAQKRGSSKKAMELDESWMMASNMPSVDDAYEAAVFRSKVEAAIRLVEKSSDLMDFSIYRMRVLEGKPGRDVAEAMGVSEPTVSRRLARVREMLRARLREVVHTYSFTSEEADEPARNGISLSPKNLPDTPIDKGTDVTFPDDGEFDDAISEIYHRQMELRKLDQMERMK